jgi:hypothetical protein
MEAVSLKRHPCEPYRANRGKASAVGFSGVLILFSDFVFSHCLQAIILLQQDIAADILPNEKDGASAPPLDCRYVSV